MGYAYADKEDTWLLKKDRQCRKCGTVFPKASSVGKFLSHIQSCKGALPAGSDRIFSPNATLLELVNK